jgi:hypothetical protein
LLIGNQRNASAGVPRYVARGFRPGVISRLVPEKPFEKAKPIKVTTHFGHGALEPWPCGFDRRGRRIYENMNQNMAMAATPIATVANQPTTRSRVEMTNLPITFGLTAMNMISAMIGTETTPLMTALQ